MSNYSKYRMLAFVALSVLLLQGCNFGSSTIENALNKNNIEASIRHVEILGSDAIAFYSTSTNYIGVSYLEKRKNRWQLIEDSKFYSRDLRQEELPAYSYVELLPASTALLFGFVNNPDISNVTVLKNNFETSTKIVDWEYNLRLWFLVGDDEIIKIAGISSPTIIGTYTNGDIVTIY